MRIACVCCKCLRTCKISWCSSPKGKLWISHNIQLQHNNNYCPFIFCDNWNTDTEQQDNGVVSTCRRISECLQICHPGLLWNTKPLAFTRLSQWFDSLYFCLNCFIPSFQMVWKECIQCLQKKRGSLRTSENGQISPGFSCDLLILTPCHTCTQTCT